MAINKEVTLKSSKRSYMMILIDILLARNLVLEMDKAPEFTIARYISLFGIVI